MGAPLFHLQLRHQYYADGNWQNLKVVPSAQTQAFVKRYQLVQLSGPGSYTLYYNGPNTTEAFVRMMPQLLREQSLCFCLQSSEPYYLNISDLPLDWAGQLQYDSHQSTVDPASGWQVMTLSRIQGTPPAPDVIGQVSIAPEHLQVAKVPVFAIEMASRLTHWSYYVSNRSQASYHELSILNDEGFVFPAPTPVTLATGEAALHFDSGQQEFPFRAFCAAPFDLVDVLGGATAQDAVEGINRNTLLQGLPIPQPDQLSIKHQNGATYAYSDLYVLI